MKLYQLSLKMTSIFLLKYNIEISII